MDDEIIAIRVCGLFGAIGMRKLIAPWFAFNGMPFVSLLEIGCSITG